VNKSTDHLEPVVLESDPRQAFLPSKEIRLLDRYELQTDLTETLEHTEKHRHLVPKVAKCHRSFRHWRCENDHDWAEAENSCSVRVCPHCAYRRTLVLADRMERFTLGKVGLRYAVLAERNTLDLREGVALLWESWTRLRRSVRWKKYVRGCIVALEVTYNREEGTWHPHLNLLLEGDFFPFEELNQIWIEATEHRGRTSFIRAADEGTVRELIKYVTKITDLLDNAPALDEFLSAIERRRLVRTYGTFYGLKVDDENEPQHEGDCPDCGPHKHVSTVKLGYVSPQQVSLDFNGVLRVKRPECVVRSELAEAIAFPAVLPAPKPFRPISTLVREWDRMQRLALQRRKGTWYD
jgi:ribosomal protein S27AE